MGGHIMEQFKAGITEAKAIFSRLDVRGQKWKSRNVPIYIRENLWRPYYLTEELGDQQLYIIQLPNRKHPKVHFIRWPPPHT